ncbi:hypothetical protein EJ110_NYTH59163 [Nymphaea thermarum]|nr:hypothetical protein EJ110_NYTH59163 [Nymphaea thermarum]
MSSSATYLHFLQPSSTTAMTSSGDNKFDESIANCKINFSLQSSSTKQKAASVDQPSLGASLNAVWQTKKKESLHGQLTTSSNCASATCVAHDGQPLMVIRRKEREWSWRWWKCCFCVSFLWERVQWIIYKSESALVKNQSTRNSNMIFIDLYQNRQTHDKFAKFSTGVGEDVCATVDKNDYPPISWWIKHGHAYRTLHYLAFRLLQELLHASSTGSPHLPSINVDATAKCRIHIWISRSGPSPVYYVYYVE